MNKIIAVALFCTAIVLTGCEVPPENVPERDMVVYRLVIKNVVYSSNTFTVNSMFTRSDVHSLGYGLSSKYGSTEPVQILDWIVSPDSSIFTPVPGTSSSFTLNEGETMPDTIVIDTTKPIYLYQTYEYSSVPGVPGEADVTVAKAYYETSEIPVTMKD